MCWFKNISKQICTLISGELIRLKVLYCVLSADTTTKYNDLCWFSTCERTYILYDYRESFDNNILRTIFILNKLF